MHMTTQWDIDDIANTRYWEGKEEGKVEDARAMLADGMKESLVAKYTGLSLEKIAAL